jgi:Holliday junction resolvasome RuvABC DNA-binding subunit
MAALTALGFSGTQAQKALSGLDGSLSVSELVKEALKKIGSIK